MMNDILHSSYSKTYIEEHPDKMNNGIFYNIYIIMLSSVALCYTCVTVSNETLFLPTFTPR